MPPPLTLLFTVGEENGLHGAKAFEPSEGGNPVMCFNLDGSGRRNGVIGALGAARWIANIRGKSVHAAVNPEGGVSAAIIAAKAIAELKSGGWFGRINKGECGSVDFIIASDYRSFRLKKSAPVVQRFLRAAPQAGREADVEIINAGLDANILNEKGIPTITFDAGNFNAHDLNEYVDIPRYLEACKLAAVLATEP
jgi:di/tripeptidase